jgi:hypothetical protein
MMSIRPTSSTAERPLLFGGTDLLPRGRASPERPNGGLEKMLSPDGGPMVRIHLPPAGSCNVGSKVEAIPCFNLALPKRLHLFRGARS